MKEKAAENFVNLVAGTTAPGVMATLLAAVQAVFTPSAGGAVASAGAVVAGGTAAAVLTPAAITGVVVCATALFAWSYLDAKGAATTEKAFQARFRQLLDEQGSLKKLLEGLSVGQIDLDIGQDIVRETVQQKAAELLAFIQLAEKDRRAAAADHTELLIYIGQQIDQRFSASSSEVAELRKAGESILAELRGEIAKSGAAVTQELLNNRAVSVETHRAMTEGFQNTNNQLQEIMRRLDPAQPSSEKLQADIDEAVSDCNSGNYGGGRKLFQRLRTRHWESLIAANNFEFCSILRSLLNRWTLILLPPGTSSF